MMTKREVLDYLSDLQFALGGCKDDIERARLQAKVEAVLHIVRGGHGRE